LLIQIYTFVFAQANLLLLKCSRSFISPRALSGGGSCSWCPIEAGPRNFPVQHELPGPGERRGGWGADILGVGTAEATPQHRELVPDAGGRGNGLAAVQPHGAAWLLRLRAPGRPSLRLALYAHRCARSHPIRLHLRLFVAHPGCHHLRPRALPL
jgi:hypothetical protein